MHTPKAKTWMSIFILLILFLPICASFYKYFLIKDYDYLVEAECDPSIEVCFSRDCSIEDECPPNMLEFYKEFHVKAFDFPKCSDNSCKEECESKVINCIEVLCDESAGDVCASYLKKNDSQ